jgi:photosynthetic reaction center cytochrome c subunit
MTGNYRKAIFAGVGLAALLVLATNGMTAQSRTAGAPAKNAGSSPKTTDEVFKNIKVLKGISSDQLIPAMQFISASLGVGCDHCHVEQRDKDDKKPKETARKMMLMMFAINKDNFDGHREVTCYSCHRGAVKPVGLLIVADETMAMMTAPPEPAAEATKAAETPALPSADQLIDNYLKALGGQAAIQKISTRVEKGTITAAGGRKFPVETFSKVPNQQVSVMHFPNGDSTTVYDGHAGWLGFPGRPPHEMGGADLYAAELDSAVVFPAGIKQLFSQLKVEKKSKVGDHEAYVVSAMRDGQPAVELYFDEQSGLLLRQVRYAESPVGLYPTQIDYSDYRNTDGVQVPFRRTTARPAGGSTLQVDEVKQNVPIDDGKFAKPAAPAPPAAKAGTP